MNIPMVDWLSVTINIENYELVCSDLLERLDRLKCNAQELRANHSSEKTIIDIGEFSFEVFPNGAASYSYILHNDYFELKLAKYRSSQEDTYPVYVHLKSECLWAYDYEIAWKVFYTWFENNIAIIKTNKLNRIDICCHTDSLDLTLNDIYSFRGKFNNDEVYRSGRLLTGIDFGSRNTGTIFARIYNKSLEIKKKKSKDWFHQVWKKAKLDISKVWNIEFELKRSFFKQIGLETASDFFSRIKDIWRYCTQEWLILTLNDNTRTDRCTVSPNWMGIQESFINHKGRYLVKRKIQIDCKRKSLIPSAMGYISSYISLNKHISPQKALANLVTEGLDYYRKKNTSLVEVVSNKRKLKYIKEV